ncbi:MAG TPA: sulfatase-like hydrolase/transferase [Bacteroidia bacterium]|nr:sulfatase-like hydrolase/transferase [Bacteroidia bacterium]
MKKLFVALLFFPLLALSQEKRPNIIFILADDLGSRDCGFTGSDYYETPNIDQLAKEGMVFSNAYSGASNCAPSRACMLSGQYTPRHGVYAVDETDRGPKDKMRLTPVPNTQELDLSIYTIPEALKDAGYTTALFGKWHFGRGQRTLAWQAGVRNFF